MQAGRKPRRHSIYQIANVRTTLAATSHEAPCGGDRGHACQGLARGWNGPGASTWRREWVAACAPCAAGSERADETLVGRVRSDKLKLAQGHSRAVSRRRLALALAARHHDSAPGKTCHNGARAPRAAARGEGKCELGRSEGASRARDRARRCDKVTGTVRAGGRVAGLAARHQNCIARAVIWVRGTRQGVQAGTIEGPRRGWI